MQAAAPYEESTSKDRMESEESFRMNRCHDCTLLDQRDPNVWNTFVCNRVLETLKVLKPVNWRYERSEKKPSRCRNSQTRCNDAKKLVALTELAFWISGFRPTKANKRWCWKKRKLQLSIGRNWSNHLWTRQSILKGSAVYRNAFVFSAILPFLHIHSRSTQKMAVRIIQLHWQIDATPFWCYYELRALNAGNSVAKMSHLLRLNPFVDDGVIKSGSRLTQNKDLTEDQRNQIVILKKSWLAKLI